MSGTQTPQSRLGKYEIRGTLGRGAMGTVYDGWDPAIARRVAIKTVRLADADDEETAEALERFKREAQAAGRLSHPNIVGVYDYGETDDIAYIVMEFVEGRSLKSVIDQERRLPPAEAVEIMSQVLAGLGYSHANGVIHRDIKPANMMITADGRVKIADFGIARIESSSMTSVGTVMGTPAYMPPEQFLGEPVDARSDIYAAGVMLFHLLTGERPYEGSMTSIMHRVLNAEAPPLASTKAGTPRAFDRVIATAMARAPADRFPSAGAFATALTAALSGALATHDENEDEDATMVARSPAAPKPAPEPLRPAKLAPPPKPSAKAKSGPPVALLGGGAAVILAAIAAAFFLLRPSPTPVRSPKAEASIAPAVTAQPAPPPQPQVLPAPTKAALPPADPTAVTRALASTPCSALQAHPPSDPGERILVDGLVGEGQSEEALRQARAAIAGTTQPDLQWSALTIGATYCPILDVLRTIGPDASSGLTLSVRDGSTRVMLQDGDQITPHIAMPGFPAWLTLDYLASDGKLAHVVPSSAGTSSKLSSTRPQPAGASIALSGRDMGVSVGPPFGRDLMIAIAAEHPLFTRRRSDDESTADYAAALAAAVTEAQRAGTRLAATALVVETRARQK